LNNQGANDSVNNQKKEIQGGNGGKDCGWKGKGSSWVTRLDSNAQVGKEIEKKERAGGGGWPDFK